MTDETLKFTQTADVLVAAGNSFLAGGNYPDAADCYYRAYLKDTDNDGIMVKLARVYSAAGDNVLAVEWYIRALNANPLNPDVYPGLVHTYSEIGFDMRDFAYYYYALGHRRGIVTNEEIEEIADFEEMDELYNPVDIEDRDLRLMGSTDEALKFQRGKDFLKENALPAAYLLFASVVESDSHYEEARRIMIKIDIERGDFKTAAALAEDLLARDEYDSEALIFGAKAYHELGDFARRDELYSKIEADKDCSCDDLETAAEVACHMERYEDALGYLLTVKRILPWDRNIMLKLALCNANLGLLEEAKICIIEAMRMYPDDLALKYYAEEISAVKGKAHFEMIDTVPEAEAVRREDILDDWLLECGSVEKVSDRIRKDARKREYLDWLFQEGDTGLQMNVARFLAQGREWKDYLEQLLIIPSVDDELKRAVLLEMFFFFAPCDIAVTTGQLYRKLHYNPPVDLLGRALDVYRYAFVVMSFFCDGVAAELDKVFEVAKERIERMEESDDQVDLAALAAAVCKVSHIGGEALSAVTVARMFDCDEKRVKKYVSGKGIDLKGLPKIRRDR